MTATAVAFMVASWAFVLGLTYWSFRRVLGAMGRRRGGDGEDDV